MLDLLTKKLPKLKSSYILSLIFLGYIFYTGFAAFPAFLSNTRSLRSGVHEYIRIVNEQYEGMLNTEKATPLLQNKGTYINLNGFMANAMGQPMMNERVKLKNGHLSSAYPDMAEVSEIQKAADNVIDFYNRQSAKGGDFLFVLLSNQISKYEDLLPTGYTDRTNDTADLFLEYLKEAGVPCLDLREEMHNDGISMAEAYYVTDHHWTPQTGFWAYGKIVEKLSDMGALGPVDSFYTDPQNFTFQSYPNTFLGSSGKRTGIYYAGLDESVIITPNFDTELSVTIDDWDICVEGSFDRVCYNFYAPHNYEDPDFYQENVYGLYGWGDTPLTKWRNPQAPEQKRFLSIGESYGNVPFCLMPLYISECDEMDMRHYTEPFEEYYTAFDPDIVVLEVSASLIPGPVTSSAYFSE